LRPILIVCVRDTKVRKLLVMVVIVEKVVGDVDEIIVGVGGL
jgi:hypothetical protein